MQTDLNVDRPLKWLAAALSAAAIALLLGFLTRDGPRGGMGAGEPHAPADTVSRSHTVEKDPARPADSVGTATEKPSWSYSQWQSAARHTYIPLLSGDSLTIHPSVATLIDLTPAQTERLNSAMRSFIDLLQAEELKHAYVRSGIEGEEIVVAAFDRSNLVESLRGGVSAALGQDVADFVADQAFYDGSLALVNSELRLSIQTGLDGADRISFTQQKRRRIATDSQTPIQDGDFVIAPTYELNILRLPSPKTEMRYAHLFSAVDTLPRRLPP